MNVVIHSREPLVFRDGRPFGDPGHVNGGMLCWPWPSTITGMLRTRISLSRDENIFQPTKKNAGSKPAATAAVEALKNIYAQRVIPLWRERGEAQQWQYLFPAPADAFMQKASKENSYTANSFHYENPFAQGGVNLPWHNWLAPITPTSGKPARDSPDLWHRDMFFTWLKNGKIAGEISARELGMSYPEPEVRMHTAIDPETGVVKTGQLFSSQGIQLATADSDRSRGGYLGIGVELSNTEADDHPFGPCFLGAERKTAVVEPLNVPFPPCPDWFADKKYLRFILISPGDFGSWAPSWLMPDRKKDETDWQPAPGTDIFLRLRSAIVGRRQPVSGWDYAVRGPKATRRLVPAGAVYVVEIQDSSRSQDLAQAVWGRPITDGLAHPDGCGAVCVGNINL